MNDIEKRRREWREGGKESNSEREIEGKGRAREALREREGGRRERERAGEITETDCPGTRHPATDFSKIIIC